MTDTGPGGSSRPGAGPRELDERTESELRRRKVEEDLGEALARGQLRLRYQPIIPRGSSPAGFEALLRWLHPERGFVLPNEFVPIAEETGLIGPIGRWGLHEACGQLAWWRTVLGAHRVGPLAINLAPRQLFAADIVGDLEGAAQTAGIPPDALVVEMTEAGYLLDAGATRSRLHSFRDLGVGVVLEDYGAGLSPLSALRDLPLTAVKLDRTLVRVIADPGPGEGIVGALIELAHLLGRSVIAEGVETEEQLDALRRAGCDRFQGYLIARPLPPEEAFAFLNRE